MQHSCAVLLLLPSPLNSIKSSLIQSWSQLCQSRASCRGLRELIQTHHQKILEAKNSSFFSHRQERTGTEQFIWNCPKNVCLFPEKSCNLSKPQGSTKHMQLACSVCYQLALNVVLMCSELLQVVLSRNQPATLSHHSRSPEHICTLSWAFLVLCLDLSSAAFPLITWQEGNTSMRMGCCCFHLEMHS